MGNRRQPVALSPETGDNARRLSSSGRAVRVRDASAPATRVCFAADGQYIIVLAFADMRLTLWKIALEYRRSVTSPPDGLFSWRDSAESAAGVSHGGEPSFAA
jgi:hypothetical protein